MRMKRRIRTDVCLILCGVLVWFLADARQLRLEAVKALTLCAGTVIPALFPFMVVTGLLVRLGFGQWLAPDMAGLMASLFRLPGCAGSALLLGLVGRLSHRRPHGGGAVRLRGPDPAGGGAAPDLLQQLQPRVPHQCAGCGRVRQRPDRTVALADPRLRRPFHRSAVPGTGPGPENRSSRHFLSGPLSASGLCVIRPGQRRDHALRLRLRHVLLCADLAPDGPPRPMGGPGCWLRGSCSP